MLEIVVRFESSWTNSFYKDQGATPLFGKLADLHPQKSPLVSNCTNMVVFDRDEALRSISRVPYLQALQAANPDMTYRVPEGFDNTAKGVLARLTGEVRRLQHIEEDHVAFRALKAGHFDIKIEDEYSQTTSLVKHVVSDHPSAGAGVVNAAISTALYSDSAISRYLFGHLDLSLEQINQNIRDLLDPNITRAWYPSSPSQLIDKLQALKARQIEIIDKDLNLNSLKEVFNQLVPAFEEDAKALIQEKRSGGKVASDWAMQSINIAGAIILLRIKHMPKHIKDLISSSELDSGLRVINQKLSISGLTRDSAAAGTASGIGTFVAKDIYNFATGRKAQAWRLPYNVSIPVPLQNGKSIQIPSGVIKKSGTFTFVLDGNDELEDEFHESIMSACVGPFHFGKKGVAYVENIKRF